MWFVELASVPFPFISRCKKWPLSWFEVQRIWRHALTCHNIRLYIAIHNKGFRYAYWHEDDPVLKLKRFVLLLPPLYFDAFEEFRSSFSTRYKSYTGFPVMLKVWLIFRAFNDSFDAIFFQKFLPHQDDRDIIFHNTETDHWIQTLLSRIDQQFSQQATTSLSDDHVSNPLDRKIRKISWPRNVQLWTCARTISKTIYNFLHFHLLDDALEVLSVFAEVHCFPHARICACAPESSVGREDHPVLNGVTNGSYKSRSWRFTEMRFHCFEFEWWFEIVSVFVQVHCCPQTRIDEYFPKSFVGWENVQQGRVKVPNKLMKNLSSASRWFSSCGLWINVESSKLFRDSAQSISCCFKP